jgi:hypothetical protein
MPKTTRQLVQDLRKGQIAHEKQDIVRFGSIQTSIDNNQNLMVQTIERVVKETVNGKIETIARKLDAYIAEDNEWKRDVKPSIENMKTFKLGTKIVIGFIGFIALIVVPIVAWVQHTFFSHK